MTDVHPEEEKKSLARERGNLFRMVLGPVVWAVHFLLSYTATAVYCAKYAPPNGDITGFRVAVAAGGGVALILLAWLGWSAWRQWDYPRHHDYVHDGAVVEDRRAFMGHAALLLVIVSVVGVVYTTLPVLVLGSCR